MEKIIIFLTGAVLLAGCSSVNVRRIEPLKEVDISGAWNDTDSRMVAEQMIKDSIDAPWVADFIKNKNRPPVIIFGSIANRSSEHIDSNIFISSLEKALINSGKIKFVASRDERNELRDERKDQAENAQEGTVTPSGFETGADYMLKGSIGSVKDEIQGKFAVLYQINLEIINLKTNDKVWIGQKEIKKVVSRRMFGL